MMALLNRLGVCAVLFIWGSVLCYFSFSGRIASYLHPSFHNATLITGIVLVALGLLMIFATEDMACNDECCPDIGDRVTPRKLVLWSILVVPLLVSTAVSPSQFGATAILNRGFVESVSQLPSMGSFQPFREPPLPGEEDFPMDPSMDISTYLMRTEEGRIAAETIDLLFAAEEDAIRADFENEPVEVIGQFLPARMNNPGGDRFNLIRLFIMCCAADGRPIAVTVKAPPGLDFPDMQWVKVKGTATFPIEGGRRVALVVADSVEEVDPPAETFLY